MKTWVLASYCDGELYSSLHPSSQAAWEEVRSAYVPHLDEDSAPDEIAAEMESDNDEVYYQIQEVAVPEAEDVAIWLMMGRLESLLKYWQSREPTEIHVRQMEAAWHGTTIPEV